jgi:hypothetical protein
VSILVAQALVLVVLRQALTMLNSLILYRTKHWCQDVATMITAHNKAMQEEYTKLNKGKKQTEQKKPEVPQVSDESTRPQLSRMEAEFPSLQSSGRRLSHQEVEEQHQMLQSYKIALEREGLNHLDLANVMIAERERNMSTSFNTDRTMHGFNIMHNGAHTMSAPRPITSFANNWDSRSPNIMSLPLGPNDTRCFPTQGADRLPFSRGAAARNYDEPRPDDPMEDSRKPAAKTDEKMKINANESTSKPSPAFIRQLYEMISDSDTNDIIHWLPCGTIFNISDKKAFTRQLIPKFQDEIAGTSNNEKFKSFKLYLKQTGFERVTSDSHNGAYKKDGFVKIQSMPAATSLGTSLINQAFSHRQQQLEMFANANRQAQLMTQYQGHRSMYPHRSSLPGMSQDEIGMGQRISNDMVFGYFQGLAAARSYDMMNNRRFSMPISLNHSYTNGHARITSKDSDDKQTK